MEKDGVFRVKYSVDDEIKLKGKSRCRKKEHRGVTPLHLGHREPGLRQTEKPVS